MAVLCFAALATLATSCQEDETAPTPPPAAPAQPTLLELAVANADLDILEAAAIRAGADVTGPLSNASANLTVFAPTDAAFISFLQGLAGAPAGLTEATAITFVGTLPATTVRDILFYHVLGSRVAASAVPENGAVATLLATGSTPIAGRVFARRSGTTVRINEATVTTADVQARNGIVHVIDDVLDVPTLSITSTAFENTQLDLLSAALNRANLESTFTGVGPWTVFAPTDAAFISFLQEAFPTSGVSNEANALSFILSADPSVLAPILQAHVVSGNRVLFAADFPTTSTVLTTLNTARSVTAVRAGSNVTVIGAGATASTVVTANVLTTNGVVHVIDRVIRL